jgi:hypothetical protein
VSTTVQDEQEPSTAGWPESETPSRRDVAVPRWVPYLVTVVVAGLSGLMARSAEAAPTGEVTPDRVLVFVLAAVVTGVGAFAPWWVLGGAAIGAGAAAIVGGTGGLVALAAVGVVCAGLAAAGERMGSTRRVELVPAAFAALAIVQVALRLSGGFHGRPSIIAALLLAAIVLGAALDGPQPVRWVAGAVGAVAAIGVVVGLAGTAVAGVSSRTDVQTGTDRLADGLDALAAGQTTTAEDALGSAADSFQTAAENLDKSWARTARWVPVLAQHRQAAISVLVAAQDLAATARDQAAQLDPNTLRLDAGHIDPQAVAALQTPLERLDQALTTAHEQMGAVRSPWLLWFVDDLLDDLDKRIDRAQTDTDTAHMAADLVPDIVGGSGPRRYLLLFLNPATSRGLGGQIAGFATVLATDGELTTESSGSLIDLVFGVPANTGVPLNDPPDFAARYEPIADDPGNGTPAPAPDGLVGGGMWPQITRSPNLPSVARAVAQLYPESGGKPIDGVVIVDPEGLAAVLRLTGPVTVPGTSETITADDVADFLLTGQYTLGADASDLLPKLVPAVVEQLLGTTFPSPRDVGAVLRPAVDEGRIGAWLVRPEEQALLDRVRATPALPPAGEGDLLAMTVDNRIGNALDPYLERSSTYKVTVFPAADRATAELEVTLTNDAPTAGVSPAVIGNFTGDPVGTSRPALSILTPLDVVTVEVDGRATAPTTATELGRNAATVPLVIPPGATTTVRFTLSGSASAVLDDEGNYVLDVRPLPAARPEQMVIEVAAPSGVPLAVVDGPLGAIDGLLRFMGEPAEPFRVRARVG